MTRETNPSPSAQSSVQAFEQAAVLLEQEGRYEEALALCERELASRTFDADDAVAARQEAQLNQRRLRLLRKLGRPTWSSQGARW
ncbi:MAG: hypothetical protein M3442_00635 [Chloroflexota bacterium]|nr:hypothetical protein [Chloroflexota bacterium]